MNPEDEKSQNANRQQEKAAEANQELAHVARLQWCQLQSLWVERLGSTEMICHAGDPYAGPQAALAKRKEHSRLRRAALSATASASWFFVDSVTPETKPGVTSVGSKPKGTFKKKRDAALSRSKNTLNTQLHCNDRIQLTSSMDPSINAFLQATINPLFCGPSDRSLQKWTRSKQRQNILRAVYQELGAFRRRSIL